MNEPVLTNPENDTTVQSPSRRRLFGLAANPVVPVAATAAAVVVATYSKPASAAAAADEITSMSATRLANLLRKREISALEAVDAYIARQLVVNDRLNAVVTNCYERARAEAKALDAKAAKGEFAGALHGVPMTIKDSLDTAGVISTGATVGRQQFVPEKRRHSGGAPARCRSDPARQNQHAGIHPRRSRWHQHLKQPAVWRLP
ncbi:MAG: amidase family protein [Cellvibrionaceae bacterium]|nr:amidase family protein [Cellvibrionaceae bacterium]